MCWSPVVILNCFLLGLIKMHSNWFQIWLWCYIMYQIRLQVDGDWNRHEMNYWWKSGKSYGEAMDGHWPCIEKIKINTPHSVHMPGHLLFHLFVLFCFWTYEVLHFRLFFNFYLFFWKVFLGIVIFERIKNTLGAVVLENHYCTIEGTWG